MADGGRWAVGCRASLFARVLDLPSRLPDGSVVIERPFTQFVVCHTEGNLTVSPSVSPADKPHTTALVFAFAVTQVHFRIDSLEVKPGGQF